MSLDYVEFNKEIPNNTYSIIQYQQSTFYNRALIAISKKGMVSGQLWKETI